VEASRLARTRSAGAAGGVAGMAQAMAQDSAAAAATRAAIRGAPSRRPASRLAPRVPARMAAKVAPSTRALAAARRPGASWSGRMPYFTGPNRADTIPAATRAANTAPGSPAASAAAAAMAIAASASLRRRIRRALSMRSASSPPRPDSRAAGATKAPAAAATIQPAPSPRPPADHSASTPKALRSRLSARADNPWHRNSGRKRRSASRKRLTARTPSRNSWHPGRRAGAATPHLATRFGPDLRRMYVSPASLSLLGYEPHELVGRHPGQPVDPGDWPAFPANLAATTASGARAPLSHRVPRIACAGRTARPCGSR